MSSRYAEGTGVPVIKSRLEIEALLQKHGAKRSAVLQEPGAATVYFEMHDRCLKFTMKLPALEQMPKRPKHRWNDYTAGQRQVLLEQAHREKWRALLLVLKAKFTALEQDVETFEQAFLAYIVLTGDMTVGEKMLPAIAQVYAGSDRPLLGAGGPA